MNCFVGIHKFPQIMYKRMIKLKKIIALFLVAILCFSFVACGKTPSNQSVDSQANNSSTTKKETVIADNESYKITIIDRSFKKESGNSDVEVPTLTMIIENKTTLDLEFIFNSVSINGFSVDVHHNPENGISTWPVIVNAEKKTKFNLAMLTDTIANVDEIVDFEATLTVNQILEMSQYYDKSEKVISFEQVEIKAK